MAAGTPVYPLRIGINTASAYIGDLGTVGRIDLTLIGDGVNFAKRLESVCESDSILIGSSTHDMLLRPVFGGITPQKRFVQIKHGVDLIKAMEYDPFSEMREGHQKVWIAHRKFLGIERAEFRWAVPENLILRVSSALGVGVLRDFSESGFAVSFDRYLGKGVLVALYFESSDGSLRDCLEKANLSPILGEVRWGRPQGDGKYLLGFLVKNLTGDQKNSC